MRVLVLAAISIPALALILAIGFAVILGALSAQASGKERR